MYKNTFSYKENNKNIINFVEYKNTIIFSSI